MKSAIYLLLAIACFTSDVRAQLVSGVTDRAIYTDTATFSVPAVAGFAYEVSLNGSPVAAGVSHTVNVMDYYELVARRTDVGASSASTQVVRFIVVSSRRGSPETGLLEWTPHPPIPSAPEEFAGAELNVVTAQNFPGNLPIPIVAWIDNGPGSARRVNGQLTSAAFTNELPLFRGVGHTFLPQQSGATSIHYNARIHSLRVMKPIQIDSNSTWQNISGIITSNTTWPENSRIRVTGNVTIPAANTLTIGSGSVIWLDPAVNITNTGRTVINGTLANPVTFTAASVVAPEQHSAAWGGFILRGATAELIANGAIFTGSGAAPNFSFSPGAAHRSEQALLLVHSGAKAFLTNCFLINNAGQIGNGYNAQITFDHCLLQRAITAGEYVNTTLAINNSAVIEFPAIDGEVNATVANSDYDGLYFTSGSYLVKDSLLGFCKDDAIDAGGDGGGSVTITNCWFESTLHEGLAWSGADRPGRVYDTVFINCGQAIECGYSAGPNNPFAYNERILALGNVIGARYGDNYTGATGLGRKEGFLTVTNSILIHNHRDVFGRVWDDTWNYRTSQMDVRSNYLSAPTAFHPANTMWNPAAHAAMLARYSNIPTNAAVGVGFANWAPFTRATVTNGILVRLSSFSTSAVEVAYDIDSPSANIASGVLRFDAGETVERIPWSATFPTNEAIRFRLRDPVAAEITTDSRQLIPTASNTDTAAVIAFNSTWQFLDDGSNQQTAWREPTFDSWSWPSGLAQFGFNENDEATQLRRIGSTGATNLTFYFRKTFAVTDPSSIANLQMRLLRDDAGVVYLNGKEVFRTPNLPAAPATIAYTTRATATGENTIDTATISATNLVAGSNLIAVEIHQESIGSSDLSFDLELIAIPIKEARLNVAMFADETLLHWEDGDVQLETATDLTNPNWKIINAANPYSLPKDAQIGFYRLVGR